MWKTIAALANFVRQGLQAQHFAVDVAEDGERARVMGSEIDYDLMILDLNVPRVMMEASPDTFAWSSGIRSSTLTSEFNLLLPIISLAAPHDQQVSCHALLLQVKDFQLKAYESHTSARRTSRATHLRNGIPFREHQSQRVPMRETNPSP